MGNVNRADGPSGIPLGPDKFLEYGVSKVADGEKTFAQAAKRLDITEAELRKANPNMKEPLTKDQKINYPKNYMNDRSETDHSSHTSHAKKKPNASKDGFEKPINVSDEGVSIKALKGNIKVTPGGDAVYEGPNINGGRYIDGDVKPKISVGGVHPGIQSKDDPIPDHTAARRKQDDPRELDTKTKEKLDNERMDPHRKIVDREVKKGFDKANQNKIDQEFEARQAFERLNNPLTRKSLRMRD
jgi:hypothetical protein